MTKPDTRRLPRLAVGVPGEPPVYLVLMLQDPIFRSPRAYSNLGLPGDRILGEPLHNRLGLYVAVLWNVQPWDYLKRPEWRLDRIEPLRAHGGPGWTPLTRMREGARLVADRLAHAYNSNPPGNKPAKVRVESWHP